jgi:hypothetical protein
MPKDFLVQAAQAYIAQPRIQIGYRIRSGGLGTVNAIVTEHPIDIAQAKSSITKRTRLDAQSSRIQFEILDTMLIKEFCPLFQEWY